MRPALALGPMLLVRGLSVNRRRPDLDALAADQDPEQFVWRVLPHVARSFATSISVLPSDQARAAAVAYLYCRMLDTYEDLIPDAETSIAELARFAARFDSEGLGGLEPATELPDELARDVRDRIYVLLISRCSYVDALYEQLPPEVRSQIRELVQSMAAGMSWSREAFERQGGVLIDEGQVSAYCHHVMGHPAIFALNLVSDRELPAPAREDAFEVSEMVQLANVTRDIERDLERGVAYHPALKPYLGAPADEPGLRAVVRDVREEYLAVALSRAPAYRRLFDGLELGRSASVRAAAVLMLLFTDLHYRSCASKTGNPVWPGPRGRLAVVVRALPALVSLRWARRTLRRVEDEFVAAARALA